MHFEDNAIIIAKRPLKETSLILTVFTESHGLYSAVVKTSKKKSPGLYEVCNMIHFSWSARLHEHIGFAKCEMLKSFSSLIMNDRRKLYAANSLVSLIKIAFIEREPHNDFFLHLLSYLESLSKVFNPADYFKLELELIKQAGYSLDFSECAANGSRENLIYVSPRSGRAVSKEGAVGFESKLLPLPGFFLEHAQATQKEIEEAIKLTSYFLERYIYHDKEPEPRRLLKEMILNGGDEPIR